MAESSIGSTSNISGPATDSLRGKVALVTGGSRGIGRAISLELARNGAAVAVNFVSNVAAAEAVLADIRAMGGECMLVQGDVSKKEAARSVIGTILEAWKRIDILVNNAGITRDRTMKKMTDEDWEAVISVNLNGTYYCTAAAMPAMIEQKYGRIINIASIVGETGSFGQSNYAASKGGIIAFTKCLALELAKESITANVVCPGVYRYGNGRSDAGRSSGKDLRQDTAAPAGETRRNRQSGSLPRPGCGLHHWSGVERKRWAADVLKPA